MPRGTTTRSTALAGVSVANSVTNEPAASRSGRQRTLTQKQHQNVVDQANKEDAAAKRAYVEALRAQQKDEEASGFYKARNDLEADASPGPESEDDGDHRPFSSISINTTPILKTTVRDGRCLVHRVNMAADSASTPPPTATKTSRQLIRRVIGDVATRQPTVQYVDRLSSGQVESPERAYYRQGNKSYYGSHENEVDDDDDGGRFEPLPTIYHDKTAVTASPAPSKHLTAATGEKIRKDHPATATASTTVLIKCAKTSGAGSRGRVRASDFDELSKSLIEVTITIYKAKLSAKHPFPERVEDRDAVKESWIEACSERNVQVELEEEVFKLVTNRAAQLRGAFKSLSKPYVLQAYDIDPQAPKREIRDKIERLLDGARFIYKDPSAKTGIFRAPVIQTLINKMWFRNKDDDGVVHPEFSENGILALATIALAFTVTENNLDEWVTGEHVDVPFTTATYRPKLRAHLKRLTDFERKTREADIIPRLQKYMLKLARKHARVAESSVPAAAELADADIEEAKKEWEELVLSDED